MLAMSLQGKWIALARKWLEQNGPCTMQEYMLGVIPLMPTHILRDGKTRASEAGLAREALRRFATQCEDGLWRANERKMTAQPIYDYSNLGEMLNSDGHIVMRLVDLPKKPKDALRKWLSHYWERVEPGVYKPRSKPNE